MTDHLLTLNAGSSSIKFALYAAHTALPERLRGQVERIGASGPRLSLQDAAGSRLDARALEDVADHDAALAHILAAVEAHAPDAHIAAVGHRVVHGGPDFAAPRVLDDGVLDRLATLAPFAPLHQPHNLAGVAAARAAFPGALQVACFDTAFHRSHPWVADTFALPREWYDKGVRRYGFHGLSYDHVAGELARARPDLAAGRVVIAHLGNGASMCALRDGCSVGSTMGFSALDGLPMGTRCGQLDPGVILYLMDQEGMNAAAISDLLYRESGLKGLSGLSHDMRTLEAAGTPAAKDAIAYFIDRIRRELGAMAAVLGGLDAMVFCGGIGENAWAVREGVLTGMGWLGLEFDPSANRAGGPVLTTPASQAVALVIPTDEERTIARGVLALMPLA